MIIQMDLCAHTSAACDTLLSSLISFQWTSSLQSSEHSMLGPPLSIHSIILFCPTYTVLLTLPTQVSRVEEVVNALKQITAALAEANYKCFSTNHWRIRVEEVVSVLQQIAAALAVTKTMSV